LTSAKVPKALAALVRETMTADPFSGPVYVFRARRADRTRQIVGATAGADVGFLCARRRLPSVGEVQRSR